MLTFSWVTVSLLSFCRLTLTSIRDRFAAVLLDLVVLLLVITLKRIYQVITNLSKHQLKIVFYDPLRVPSFESFAARSTTSLCRIRKDLGFIGAINSETIETFANNSFWLRLSCKYYTILFLVFFNPSGYIYVLASISVVEEPCEIASAYPFPRRTRWVNSFQSMYTIQLGYVLV